jgi:hypothetical protein
MIPSIALSSTTSTTVQTIPFAGGLLSDLPYGVLDPDTTGVDWDIRFTMEEFDTLLRQFEAIQKAASWFVCFMCDPSQMGEIMDALKEQGYVYITPFYWIKEGHTKVGTTTTLTPAVECMVVARKQRRGDAAYTNMDENPTLRYNYLVSPPQRTLLKDAAGEVINITQKPPAVSAKILSMFAPPNKPILVVGTGAGGEVKGCIETGFSVIGLDKDRRQVEGLQRHLLTLQATTEAQEERDEQTKNRRAKRAAGVKKTVAKTAALPAVPRSTSQEAEEEEEGERELEDDTAGTPEPPTEEEEQAYAEKRVAASELLQSAPAVQWEATEPVVEGTAE